MELFEAIQRRRSVRQFTGEPVGREVLERMVQAAIEAPTGCNVQQKQYIIVDDPETMDRLRFVSKAMSTAPAAIVLLTEEKGTKYGSYWVQDVSAAMQNMLLAAVALGYDACWIEGNVRPHEDELRRILNVPKSLRVWSLTPVGKAVGEGKRPPKPAMAEVTHYNGFEGQRGP
jgi:nitroreductase